MIILSNPFVANAYILKGINYDGVPNDKAIEHNIIPLSKEELVQAESITFHAKTNDSRDLLITPFNGSQEHIEAFTGIINHPDVFPRLRHMGKWWIELIGRTVNRYVIGVRDHLKNLKKKKYPYSTKMDVCWVVYLDGRIVARGGLQEDEGSADNGINPATELYFAVHPDYRKLGISIALATVATKHFESLETGFPLRSLELHEISISKKIIDILGGFKNTGKKSRIEKWGDVTYWVFERMPI